MTTYALNGLGRIGKLALRPLLEQGAKIAFINDAVGDPEMHAHLLEFDTVHGRWQADFAHDADSVTINGTRLPFIGTRDLSALPLDGVDVVIDCTGVFKTEAKLAPYFEAGVKKVVISAPVKDGDAANIVYGVNDDVYDPARHRIVTAASCTTNCLAPVAKVLDDTFGIETGYMTTIHAYTGDQPTLDRRHEDLYRARAAAMAIIPTSTGAAKALGEVLPALKGKLDGTAMRVPTPNVSAVDLTFMAGRDVTVEEVNEAMRAAANGPMSRVFAYDAEQKVSVDFNHTEHSSIFAPDQTKVVGNRLVRVLAWYDNEWAFSVRMADVAVAMGKLG